MPYCAGGGIDDDGGEWTPSPKRATAVVPVVKDVNFTLADLEVDALCPETPLYEELVARARAWAGTPDPIGKPPSRFWFDFGYKCKTAGGKCAADMDEARKCPACHGGTMSATMFCGYSIMAAIVGFAFAAVGGSMAQWSQSTAIDAAFTVSMLTLMGSMAMSTRKNARLIWGKNAPQRAARLSARPDDGENVNRFLAATLASDKRRLTDDKSDLAAKLRTLDTRLHDMRAQAKVNEVVLRDCTEIEARQLKVVHDELDVAVKEVSATREELVNRRASLEACLMACAARLSHGFIVVSNVEKTAQLTARGREEATEARAQYAATLSATIAAIGNVERQLTAYNDGLIARLHGNIATGGAPTDVDLVLALEAVAGQPLATLPIEAPKVRVETEAAAAKKDMPPPSSHCTIGSVSKNMLEPVRHENWCANIKRH